VVVPCREIDPGAGHIRRLTRPIEQSLSAPMEHRVRIRYSEAMLRQAVRLYVWRSVVRPHGWLWLCAVLLLVVSFIAGLNSESPALSGIGVAAVIVIFVFFVAIWRAHFVRTVGTFRAMTSPEADVVLRDADITITSTLGSVTLPWRRVIKVWEATGFWMLFLAPNQFITLPLDSLSPDLLRFVRSKLP
jgi:hypothetical protein